MKTFIQMMSKCSFFVVMMFLFISNVSSSTLLDIRNAWLMQLIDPEEWSLSAMRSALTSYKIEEIEMKWKNEQNVSDDSMTEKKKIYLYNTHQSEEYIDGVTIFEVTYQFAKMLQNAGFEVVFETSDFLSELEKQKKKYNQLYTISKIYLEEALISHGPFDLIIDVHRDSTSRSVCIVESEGVLYARLMFVIGNKSSLANNVRTHAVSLTDKMNQRLDGIMRAPFTRQSVYNQDVSENMLLLEVGSDQNTSSEALRSLEIFVEMLKTEGIK